MAQGGSRSQRRDIVLTPQAISTSNLILGPVLHHPGNFISSFVNRLHNLDFFLIAMYLYQSKYG